MKRKSSRSFLTVRCLVWRRDSFRMDEGTGGGGYKLPTEANPLTLTSLTFTIKLRYFKTRETWPNLGSLLAKSFNQDSLHLTPLIYQCRAPYQTLAPPCRQILGLDIFYQPTFCLSLTKTRIFDSQFIERLGFGVMSKNFLKRKHICIYLKGR